MKIDNMKKRENSVTAQDVQNIFPEMVSTIDRKRNYRGVRYIQLVPAILKAIKKQQLDKMNLQKRVSTLEAHLVLLKEIESTLRQIQSEPIKKNENSILNKY